MWRHLERHGGGAAGRIAHLAGFRASLARHRADGLAMRAQATRMRAGGGRNVRWKGCPCTGIGIERMLEVCASACPRV